MKFKLGILLIVATITTPAYAAVYKCTNDAGHVEFRDRPCEAGRQQQLDRKPAPAAASSGAEPTTSSATSIQGTWCEYAVSLSPDGEKDASDPATWTFNADGTMTYESAAFRSPLRARYELKGDLISVDNSMIGSWRIYRSIPSGMTMSGPIGGYGHWRRGGC